MLVLETSNKRITLSLKTRKIVDIITLAGAKNFEDYFFKTLYNKDLKALSEIIYSLVEVSEGENRPFASSTAVYDFIDVYKYEKNISYADIFDSLAEFINNEGFFNTKMSPEELEAKKNNLMTSMDMEKVMDSVLKDVSKEVAKEEIQDRKSQDMFKGYQA